MNNTTHEQSQETTMKNLLAIINAKGGLELLPLTPIHLENPPYMPLGIELVGTGPRGGAMVAVHHSKVINGDLCFDPEVVFELIENKWHPISFEQTGQIYREVTWIDEKTGKVMIWPAMVKDLLSFCRMWDRNLRDQGWVKVAKG